MKPLFAAALAAAALASALPAPALAAAKVPTKVGQCVSTTIKEKFSRLEGVPDSGSGIEYANGIVGVSYDIIRSHNGRIGYRRGAFGGAIFFFELPIVPNDPRP